MQGEGGLPRRARARRLGVVALLGGMTILTYGTTYYLLTVLAPPIVADTGWPLAWVVGGLSLGLLLSGLAAPSVGQRIERHGGRAVLPAACLVLAAGLLTMGLAEVLWLYLLAWVVIGLGMAGALYDAAFARLGRQYGLRARGLITLLTLFGGLASTACWPLSALLVDWLGWRGTCLAYAGTLTLLAIPVRLVLAPPPLYPPPSEASAASPSPGLRCRLGRRGWILVALGLCLALSATLTTVMAVHLVALLGARDVALAAAVAFGTLIGPSQVGGRIVEYVIGRRFHPLWTLQASTLLMAVGLGLLTLGWGWVALALVLYGGGVGIKSIAAGTVPLALVGDRGYATIMGRLAAPSLELQALAPAGAAAYMEGRADGGGALLWLMAAVALVNLGLSLGILWWRRRPRG